MKLTVEREGNSEILMVEDATQDDIRPGSFFRNFAGEERKNKGKIVNSEGRRNFCLVLNFPEDILDELQALGLKIVELSSDNDEYNDGPLRFVRVEISTEGKRPTEMYLVNDAKKECIPMTPPQYGKLDRFRFSNVNLVIRTWHKDDGSTALYLNAGYFSIVQNRIADKFSDYKVVGTVEDDEELPFEED